MKGSTHLAAGLVAAALVPKGSLAIAAGVTLGSLLPDVDKSSSMLGSHVPIIPKLLTHRGVTHSLLFALALFPVNKGLTLGCLVHLFLDMCNPAVVALIWPVRRKKELIRTKIPIVSSIAPSGGFLDKLLGAGLWLEAAILFWGIITETTSFWAL